VKLDTSLLEASADLGSRPWQTFLSVTLPLSMPGIIAGSMLVFIPAIGEFVIPSLLGGPETLMIGRVLWDEFFAATNWPRAAAVAITMLLVVVIPIMLMQKAQNAVVEGPSLMRRNGWFLPHHGIARLRLPLRCRSSRW
jgi:putrescine transport system permease protein